MYNYHLHDPADGGSGLGANEVQPQHRYAPSAAKYVAPIELTEFEKDEIWRKWNRLTGG